MVEINVSVPVELDDQFFEDIMVTSFEGGSNYWLETAEVVHPSAQRARGVALSVWAATALNAGGSVVIGFEDEKKTLTQEMLVKGVELWIAKHPQAVSFVKDHKSGKRQIETCNVDADDADAILQYALFGELVYG